MNQEQLEQVVKTEIRKMLIKMLFVVIPVQLILTVILGAFASKLVEAQMDHLEYQVDLTARRIEKQITEDLPETLETKIQEAMQGTKEKLAPKLPKIDGLRGRLGLPD